MDELFPIKKENNKIEGILFGGNDTGEMKPVKVTTNDTFLDEISSADTVVDMARLPLPTKSYSIKFSGVRGRTLFILKSMDMQMCQIMKPDASKMIEFKCFLSNEHKNMLKNLSYIEILQNSLAVKRLFVDSETIEETFSTNVLVFRVYL